MAVTWYVLVAFLILNNTVYAFQVGWRPASAHCCPHLSIKKKGVCSMYVNGNKLMLCVCFYDVIPNYILLGIPLCGLLSARLVAMYIAVAIRPRVLLIQ